jgi:predicted alpha/beta superfamily hydrolase
MNSIFRILCLLAISSLASAESMSFTGIQALEGTQYHAFESESLDKRYHLLVSLPDGYEASADKEYATLYILDGGVHYAWLKAYSDYLAIAEDFPELILVGISYGTNDWQNGNDRSHDYTAPTDEREFWGGAGDFQVFLREELIPFIEREYRSDATRRIVFGQSLGGQFVLYSAQTEPGLFWGHIASNAALHRNLPLFLDMRPEQPRHESHLFIGDATEDAAQFHEPRQKWIRHWTAQSELPWRLHVERLDGHDHFSSPPAAFRQGVLWLFGN